MYDFDFAQDLFDLPLDQRYNWLESKAKGLLKAKGEEYKISQLEHCLEKLRV